MVNGWPDPHQLWDGVAARLADRFRIVRYDNRGVGKSSVPKQISSYSVAGLADDLGAVIAAVDPDGPVHLLGHGWGSVAVWDYLTRPGSNARVASFTSVSPVDRLLRMRHRCPLRIHRALAKSVPGPGRRVDVPVQLIVAANDPSVRRRGFDDLRRRVPRLWRRDIRAGEQSPTSHPQVVAAAVGELADFLDGRPPARSLLRSQVGRERPDFGDTLVSVTGAGSGIGRATALAFARAGAELVVSDIDEVTVAETAAQIVESGGVAHPYVLDVSDAAAVERFAVEVCATHGVPDIVVNNAGIGQAGEFLTTPADQWDRVLDINFGGVVNGCRAFGKRLVERGTGGHIVNVASMASYAPSKSLNAYCTSKAAVYMFSDCLRAELDSAGVGLTTICPGVIDTNIVAATRFDLLGRTDESLQRRREQLQRLFRYRRYGPDKVAKAILAAVKTNKATRPVAPEAYLLYGTSRIAPQVLRSTARWDLV
ncbi:short chain dehydrogenase [Mycolicibacterium agri]|nr:short chain dehydrogenase [Mycolicibacterium agri]